MVFPLLAKMILPKVIKKVTGKAAAAAGVEVPTQASRPMPVIVLMASSTLIMIPGLILVFLCLFAGYKPGMMDGYAVYTVNVSRIGENILSSIDQQIQNGSLIKRDTIDLPAFAASPVVNIMARGKDHHHHDDQETSTSSKENSSPFDFLTDADDHSTTTSSKTTTSTSQSTTDADEETTTKTTTHAILSSRDEDEEHTTLSLKTTKTVQSTIIAPKPTSMSKTPAPAKTTPTPAPSKSSGVTGAAPSAVVKQVNKAFASAVDHMNLHDFVDFHVLSQCYGSYVNKNGSQAANATTGSGPLPKHSKTKKRVESCEIKRSALTLTAITYGFGIACTSTAFLVSLWAIVSFKKKPVLITIGATSAAFLVQALSSAAATAIANSATGLVDFIGNPVGIDASAGNSFLTLSWACTVLLGLVATIWGLLYFFGRKQPAFHGAPASRPVSVQYELKGFPYQASDAEVTRPGPAPTRPPRPATAASTQWI